MPTDLDKLQGAWEVTSLEVDGEKLPATAISGSRIVISGNKFTSTGMGAAYEGRVELQRSKKTKAFDLLFTAGPERGNRNLGIYKLDGERWTICLATRGSERPQKFASTPGSGIALETLRRSRAARKPGKKKASETATASGAATELEGEWAMVSGVFSGDALDKKMVQWCKRVTRGNVTTVTAGPQTFLKANFTLDNLKNPRAIDYNNLGGANAGKSQAGIFELSGEILRICMSAPGQPRPADFFSKSGDGRSYTAWRLVRK